MKNNTNFNSPQHFLRSFVEDDIVNMIVEIPKGSINKYEIQKDTGLIKLDRVLFEAIEYEEYGLIPQTYDEDDDLLDVMSLVTYPTFPGCIIEGRVIGVCHFEDTSEVDDKIIVVPNDDFRFSHIKDIKDVPESKILEIEFFWNNYKQVQLKWKKKEGRTEVKGWGNKSEALEVIKKAQKLYETKYPENPFLKND